MLDFNLAGTSLKTDISKVFDLAVIGAGPAGLTAALYSGRYRLKTLLIEKKLVCGGQLATINSLENYPGFSEPVSGGRIAREMERQVIKSDVQILTAQVNNVDFSGEIKEIATSKGLIKAKALVISAGATPRMLGVAGEKENIGKGVSYCATCDGHLYIDKTIAVVGGGNTALEETITLTKYAKKIFLIHRRGEFRADKILQEKVRAIPKIEFILDTAVEGIDFSSENGKNVLINTKGKKRNLEVDGIFIFVGILPNSEIFEGSLKLKDGFIVTDEEMKTNIEGIFAAGDIRLKSLRQITTAVSDGAVAAFSAKNYLTEKNL
ncbi:MAG: FAD-dependent oxidoreductase [Candidatus Omnitrophica bacterium]|nr:FAD-dependent oxidoreductase [Candidatus Omnitrophota bacterium]